MHPLSWLKELTSHIDREDMLELAGRLMEKNTTNPPGNEYLVKDIIMEYLERIGARVEVFERAPKRSNIVGSIGKGRPVVAIICHMDVVPPGEGWEFDPFSPQIRDGRIYGRGAVDNKGPFAASWAGIKALLDAGIPLKGTLVLGATADEERGSFYGMEYLLQEGFQPDFCIIPDGGRLDKIVIGEKGRIEVHLCTRGKSAHASEPQEGKNAIYKMVDYLGFVKKGGVEGKHHHLFSPATVNLGEIKGGQAPNVVADSCEATLDIRYPLGMDREGVLSQLRHLASQCGLDVEMSVGDFLAQPHLLDTEHSLVQVFKDVAYAMGISLCVGTAGGITLAKNLYFRGVPALVHSPATESVAHQANEYVEIDNLITCAKLWAGVAGRLLGA